ncbi:MAG: hypothetical protein LBG59_08030 [Candidatus Peribacteria bacterium]|jgi:hypothetical protein|nr:hypothetical protein [Candidatus Peribacteria bacterium]
MYVYLKDNHIYHKSEEKKLIPNTTLIEVVGYKITDDLIYEDGEIKLYINSEQYQKDKNIQTNKEKIAALEKRNKELNEVADGEVRRAVQLGDQEKVS